MPILTKAFLAAAILVGVGGVLPAISPAGADDAASDRVIIHGPVWSCPTVETLQKLMRAGRETEARKDLTMLSLTAHLDWHCQLFTAGDVIFVDERDGPWARVHRRGEMQEFWTLGSLLAQ